MDLNNIGETEDRISELPDTLLHHILSFLDIKCVFCTYLLSKRWNSVWTSIPVLNFSGNFYYSEINNYMDFVDRTLHLHDTSSNIQKLSLDTSSDMSASRVHSWISNISKRNVEELILDLELGKPFFVPLSLFTCESLIKLDLRAYHECTVHLPRSFSFPKLKRLRLFGIHFTDDDCWNEQHFSNCPVLEELNLECCTWFGVRNFCISTSTLKHLEISNDTTDEDGLPNCALKIHAPNLVSLTYRGSVAKEYVISSFQTLESAKVLLYGYEVHLHEQKISYYGAAISKFFQALSHVQSLTIETLEVSSIVGDFVSILPMFHNLDKLFLDLEESTDKSAFRLLKAAPNLTRLVFTDRNRNNKEEEDSWAGHMLTAGCLFQHLRSVCFVYFSGKVREMRWLKLILKNAKALQTVDIGSCHNFIDAETKEVLMSELSNLPKASGMCVLKFHW